MRHGLSSCQPSSKRSRTDPPHRAEDLRGRSGCITRVQENAGGGKLQLGRFRSWNRGERRCLPQRSKQSDSVAPSTPTGQSQLWKWTSCRWSSRAALDSRSYESRQDAGGVRGRDGIEFEGRNPGRSASQSPSSFSVVGLGAAPDRRRLTMQVGVGDGPGKGCAESLMRRRRREPLASSAETEGVHAVLGVHRSLSSVARGTFRSFSRSIGGKSPLYGRRKVNTFRKGAFRTAMTSPNVENDIGRPGGAASQ